MQKRLQTLLEVSLRPREDGNNTYNLLNIDFEINEMIETLHERNHSKRLSAGTQFADEIRSSVHLYAGAFASNLQQLANRLNALNTLPEERAIFTAALGSLIDAYVKGLGAPVERDLLPFVTKENSRRIATLERYMFGPGSAHANPPPDQSARSGKRNRTDNDDSLGARNGPAQGGGGGVASRGREGATKERLKLAHPHLHIITSDTTQCRYSPGHDFKGQIPCFSCVNKDIVDNIFNASALPLPRHIHKRADCPLHKAGTFTKWTSMPVATTAGVKA
jgi:hypothetical protein